MTFTAGHIRRILSAIALFLLGAIVFSAAYCQAPLYYSNQNQYFLHGLANAGHGRLSADWLANTDDPTPVFSGLVTLTVAWLHPWVFHVYHGLLLGAYAAAMMGLFLTVAGQSFAAQRWPVFLALFILFHSALARWCSYHWLGQDYPWYFQAGVAGQYVLGAMFQPSVFGVLLIVAVCVFVRGYSFAAVVCVALTVAVHTTYLLPAGLLVLGFMTALRVEGQSWQAVRLGVGALALVLPPIVYALVVFGPTSPSDFDQAQNLLVNVRIPHHARTDCWLDVVAGLQIAWVALALVLVRGTKLCTVLAVPFLLSVLLTVVQAATNSPMLALLFPWRISAVLVPIATTVILSRLVTAPRPRGLAVLGVITTTVILLRLVTAPRPRGLAVLGAIATTEILSRLVMAPAIRLEGPVARWLSAVVMASLAAAGVWINVTRLGFHAGDEELPLFAFVRETQAPGDLYVLPVRVPDLAATTRGSLSSDFKPLPDKKHDARLVPVDLQRFRLATGTPIYVDFKSIPYKDTDVIEWHSRLSLAQALQEDLRQGSLASVEAKLRDLKATHLVLPAAQEVSGPGLKEVYADPYYRVYRLP